MFLVCKDILCGLETSYYIKRKDSKVILTIPSEHGENVVFSSDEFPVEALENENILIENASVTVSDGKSSIHYNKTEPGTMYALLRGADCVPDDVFISKKHANHFNLIKKISYTTCEPDLGCYTASVYFVKISLEPNEFVHIYFSFNDAYFLTKHIALYSDDNKKITLRNNLQTFIPNNAEFMSLSKLNSVN